MKSSAVLAILLSLSLGSESLGQAALVHPDEKNLTRRKPTTTLSRADSVSTNPELNFLARRLRQAIRVDSIGDVDGDEASVLGTIMEVVVDSSGRVGVLDMAFQQLRIFSAAGRPAFIVGQKGSGPMDFRFAVAAWVQSAGDFVVVDAVLGAKQLSLRDRQSARLVRVTPLGADATGACGVGGSLVAYAPTTDPALTLTNTLHRYDSTGRLVRSFGDGYRADSRLVTQMMSEGTVGCAPDGTVVAALSKLPFAQAFSEQGALRWTTRFSSFTIGRELEEVDDRKRRSIGIDPASPAHSYIRRIASIDRRFTAVQITLATLKSLRARESWARLDTYLLDNATGVGVFVSDRLPMLSGRSGDRVVGFENDPFPRVIFLRLSK